MSRKPEESATMEAQFKSDMPERGPVEWAGVTLIPGEWTPVTAEQAQALTTVPGVRLRAIQSTEGS